MPNKSKRQRHLQKLDETKKTKNVISQETKDITTNRTKPQSPYKRQKNLNPDEKNTTIRKHKRT